MWRAAADGWNMQGTRLEKKGELLYTKQNKKEKEVVQKFHMTKVSRVLVQIEPHTSSSLLGLCTPNILSSRSIFSPSSKSTMLHNCVWTWSLYSPKKEEEKFIRIHAYPRVCVSIIGVFPQNRSWEHTHFYPKKEETKKKNTHILLAD